MKVTGYKIREAITRQKLRRETASSQFADSLHVFPGEEKRTPDQLATDIELAEMRIARLQVAQDAYNAQAGIALHIKTIGGLERLEKLWRSAAVKKKDRFSFSRDNPLLRDEKQVQAKVVVRPEQAALRVESFNHQIAELRAAIGVANGKEIEIDLDPSVFD